MPPPRPHVHGTSPRRHPDSALLARIHPATHVPKPSVRPSAAAAWLPGSGPGRRHPAPGILARIAHLSLDRCSSVEGPCGMRSKLSACLLRGLQGWPRAGPGETVLSQPGGGQLLRAPLPSHPALRSQDQSRGSRGGKEFRPLTTEMCLFAKACLPIVA